MDAFRTIPMMSTGEPRQTTSNIGYLHKPSPAQIIRGLNKYYYSIVINTKKSEMEQRMLHCLNKVEWSKSLVQKDYVEHKKNTVDVMKKFAKMTGDYEKWIKEENTKSKKEMTVWKAGKVNPSKHLSN